jgi:hypothetical protein
VCDAKPCRLRQNFDLRGETQRLPMLASYPFHATVFVLPPWEVIYANDAERDQSFAEAVDVHAKVVRWYRSCGCILHEAPRLPVAQRAEHVLRISPRARPNLRRSPTRYGWLRQISRAASSIASAK